MRHQEKPLLASTHIQTSAPLRPEIGAAARIQGG